MSDMITFLRSVVDRVWHLRERDHETMQPNSWPARTVRQDTLGLSVGEYWSVYPGWILCSCPLSPVDRVDISEETEETIDQVAVLTSNVLFFIVMFVFAIFETYVIRHRVQTQSNHNDTDSSYCCGNSIQGVFKTWLYIFMTFQNCHPFVHGHVCLDKERSCFIQWHHHLLHRIWIHPCVSGCKSGF